MTHSENMSWRFRMCGVLLAVLFFAVSASYAQQPNATILGTVKDSTGGTVAGATVTVTNVDTGLSERSRLATMAATAFPPCQWAITKYKS